MRLTIVPADSIEFEQLYEAFFESYGTASFFYTTPWRKYQLAYSEDALVEDISVVIVDDKGLPVCACPLYLEQYGGERQISFRGEALKALRAPLVAHGLSKKLHNQVLDHFFEHLDNAASAAGAVKATFLIDPLCQIFDDERYNFLSRYGFLDSSMHTRLIDLSPPTEQLWMGLRQSYKPIINKGLREFQHRIVDAQRPDLDAAHAAYVEIHHRAAGRVTRPLVTFELQKAQIRAGFAFLTELALGSRIVAYNFYGHTRASSYYVSAGLDPDFKTDLHLGHVMQWVSMLHLKSLGVRYMELDNQYVADQLFEHPTTKEISISKFKAGFGGRNVPLFRGIKYYDADVYEREMADNVRQSSDAIRARLAGGKAAAS